MPSFRSSFLIREGLAGWSESYLAAGAVFASLTAAADAAEALLADRRNLSPEDVIFQAIRTSDMDDPRKVLIRTYNQIGTFPLTQGGQPSNKTDMPWTSLRSRFNDAIGHSRLLYMRGLPDLLTDFDSGTINNPNWITAWNSWRETVLANGYGGRSLSRGTNAVFPIDGFTMTVAGIVVTAPGHGYTSGNRVRITGSNTDQKLNGTWRITVIDADTFLLRGSKKGTDEIIVIKTGRVWRFSVSDWIATDVRRQGFSSRKIGRPFGLYRGRKKTPQ